MQIRITVFLADWWGAEECYAKGGIEALEELCREEIDTALEGAVFEVVPAIDLPSTDVV